jgi:predicted DNA-binding ribbon-helix-helix protein
VGHILLSLARAIVQCRMKETTLATPMSMRRKRHRKSPDTRRTVSIDGRRTSVSLEDAFWSILKDIAQAQGATVSQRVTEIDKSRQGGNLSSAIRLFVLDWVRSGQMGKQV